MKPRALVEQAMLILEEMERSGGSAAEAALRRTGRIEAGLVESGCLEAAERMAGNRRDAALVAELLLKLGEGGWVPS